jgi:hypothetical protein
MEPGIAELYSASYSPLQARFAAALQAACPPLTCAPIPTLTRNRNRRPIPSSTSTAALSTSTSTIPVIRFIARVPAHPGHHPGLAKGVGAQVMLLTPSDRDGPVARDIPNGNSLS